MNAPEASLSSAKSLAQSYLLDSICDSFEAAWKEGSAPSIDDYLSDADEAHARELFEELIHVDMYYRRRNGEHSSIDDYIIRYPQYSTNLTLPRPASDGPARPAEQVPTTRHIGDYELRDQIGAGSFGTVWRAWHPQLHRMDAIKLPQHGVNDREQIDVLHHEARAAAKLNHPHVVRVIGFGEWSQRPYIVFEFIEGITLKKWRKREPRDHRTVTELVMKLADGIQHAHELNIIHRDLKPQNILIDEEGEPHITDFGMAKRLDFHSTIAVDGVIMGTVPYMSPEQVAADHDQVTAASDIYSLGVILYELLTESLPFEGAREKMMLQIQHDDPPPMQCSDRSIPRDLETICLKTLQKSPADRYATAAEFRDDLQRVLDGQPILARRLPATRRVFRWVRRHTVQIMAVLLLITGSLLMVDLLPGEPVPPVDPEPPSVGQKPPIEGKSTGEQGLPVVHETHTGPRTVRVESLPAGAVVSVFHYNHREWWDRSRPAVVDQITPFDCELEPDDYYIVARLGEMRSEANVSVPDDGSEFRWPLILMEKDPDARPPTP